MSTVRVIFYSESRVLGMSWSQIMSKRGLADKKTYLGENIFLTIKDIEYVVK